MCGVAGGGRHPTFPPRLAPPPTHLHGDGGRRAAAGPRVRAGHLQAGVGRGWAGGGGRVDRGSSDPPGLPSRPGRWQPPRPRPATPPPPPRCAPDAAAGLHAGGGQRAGDRVNGCDCPLGPPVQGPSAVPARAGGGVVVARLRGVGWGGERGGGRGSLRGPRLCTSPNASCARVAGAQPSTACAAAPPHAAASASSTTASILAQGGSGWERARARGEAALAHPAAAAVTALPWAACRRPLAWVVW